MTLNEFITKFYNDVENGMDISGLIDIGSVKMYRAGTIIRIDVKPATKSDKF